MTSPRITVLVADDQAMIRAGLGSLLSGEPDLAVVGEVGDGDAAVRAARRLEPDVVLMDIRMPVLDGIEATRRIAAAGLPSRVLILTTFELDEYVFAALRSGASGFLLKDAPAEELAAAIRTVAGGDSLLAPRITTRVVDAFATRAAVHRPAAGDEVERLTPREREVLELLARGRSNPAIAETLVVTEATAKTHVSNLLAKLGLRDRVQAVIFAYERGIVTPGDFVDHP